MSGYYLLDANVVLRLSGLVLKSDLVVQRCHVPGEVIHEARFSPNAGVFAHRAIPATPSVLAELKRVWSVVPEDDTDLVDLFKGKGAADPLLVAIVLDQQSQASNGLFSDEWTIVTDDRAVENLAKVFAIPTVGLAEFEERASAERRA